MVSGSPAVGTTQHFHTQPLLPLLPLHSSLPFSCPRDVAEDAARFREALALVALVAAGCTTLLQVLQLTTTLGGAAADGVDVGQMLGLGPW